MSCLRVTVLYEWNVTKTNSCAHYNVTGEYIYLHPILVFRCCRQNKRTARTWRLHAVEAVGLCMECAVRLFLCWRWNRQTARTWRLHAMVAMGIYGSSVARPLLSWKEQTYS